MRAVLEDQRVRPCAVRRTLFDLHLAMATQTKEASAMTTSAGSSRWPPSLQCLDAGTCALARINATSTSSLAGGPNQCDRFRQGFRNDEPNERYRDLAFTSFTR